MDKGCGSANTILWLGLVWFSFSLEKKSVIIIHSLGLKGGQPQSTHRDIPRPEEGH